VLRKRPPKSFLRKAERACVTGRAQAFAWCSRLYAYRSLEICTDLGATFENCIASTSILRNVSVTPCSSSPEEELRSVRFSSYKEPTVDALAPDADEGRGWLRKATGSCRPSAMTRGYPNGETRLGSCPVTPARTHRAGGGHRGN